jgi:hypothetical protein
MLVVPMLVVPMLVVPVPNPDVVGEPQPPVPAPVVVSQGTAASKLGVPCWAVTPVPVVVV